MRRARIAEFRSRNSGRGRARSWGGCADSAGDCYPKNDVVAEVALVEPVNVIGVVEKSDEEVGDPSVVFSCNPPFSNVPPLPDEASVPEVSVEEPGVLAPLSKSLVTVEVVLLVGASRSIA